jgi:hypothetical protein
MGDRNGRIWEAVLIAGLTALFERGVEYIFDRLEDKCCDDEDDDIDDEEECECKKKKKKKKKE